MRNRGPQPNDPKLFAPRFWPALRAGTDDLSWLLGRGYGPDSALQLVGNQYRLNKRQRQAVGRAAAAPASVTARRQREVPAAALAGRTVAIDGFNLLILLESAYGGGLVLDCRDGTYRDLASVHGTYKHVQHTRQALVAVGEALQAAATVVWYFDTPVSNSGRLKTLLGTLARTHDFSWEINLVYNPDKELIDLPDEVVLVTSDSWILDDGGAWCNLGRQLVEQVPQAWVVRV